MIGNRNIKFNGKCLIYNNWIKDKIIFINDLIDDNGNISQNYLLSKISSHHNWFSEFSKLIAAIPKIWITKLSSDTSKKTMVKTNCFLKLKSKNGQENNIHEVSSKELYHILNDYNCAKTCKARLDIGGDEG